MEKLQQLKILDKFILKQIIEVFVLGVVIFTSIIFASDTFITLIKQISMYGIPLRIAFMIVLLNLPAFIIMTIPMSMLLSTVMVLNKLCLSSEITVMRACGIGIARISKSIFIFAIVMSSLAFVANETIVPSTSAQSKTLALWAIGQKNIPKGKQNFTIKEAEDGKIKRLFYVEKCNEDSFENVTVLDFSKKNTIQIIQSKLGTTTTEGWKFINASVYTISDKGKILNTSWFNQTIADFGMNIADKINQEDARNFNLTKLSYQLLKNKHLDKKTRIEYEYNFYDKIAFPFTTVILVLLGIPLAITPPRVRYNRGFLFSILIIFLYYLLKSLSYSFGVSGVLPIFVAAWLPNIILASMGAIMFYRKAFKVN